MREIKFRVWNKTDEEMCYLLENGWSFGPSEEVRAFSWEDVFAAREQDLIPLQYTGLKDKNGVEIYEGNILQSSNGEKNLYPVVWSKSDSGFKRQHKFIQKYEGEQWEETALITIHAKSFIVVGNIHENPELLEAKP